MKKLLYTHKKSTTTKKNLNFPSEKEKTSFKVPPPPTPSPPSTPAFPSEMDSGQRSVRHRGAGGEICACRPWCSRQATLAWDLPPYLFVFLTNAKCLYVLSFFLLSFVLLFILLLYFSFVYINPLTIQGIHGEEATGSLNLHKNQVHKHYIKKTTNETLSTRSLSSLYFYHTVPLIYAWARSFILPRYILFRKSPIGAIVLFLFLFFVECILGHAVDTQNGLHRSFQ